ncbi:unnamed protein product [Aphanomyces euteiches]|uniref:Uncharacterized protein n=1 Tax=Aphanomyces euteiches TaxID=100861 RepID=A0A6G0WHR7_9STRA|nr:hypothetical protein Ae201684_015118 [Aphanomyces euteiches]KAH9063013.1 hypothetical protein Ae201684P_009278 [Aphanomyces euteiches]KAH9150618.1 hypothetical protein AeRB84_006584 [Aphanomyces euteiches]
MASTSSKCFFNDCNNVVLPGSFKCVFHRNRSRCLHENCQNQVYARNLCVRHGGRKRCIHDGCELNARLGDVCSKHGAGLLKKRCTHPDCSNQAHARGKCVRHGGGRKCKAEDCHRHARLGGFCSKHNRSPSPPQATIEPELKVETMSLPLINFCQEKPELDITTRTLEEWFLGDEIGAKTAHAKVESMTSCLLPDILDILVDL